jgi:hypothetical protein
MGLSDSLYKPEPNPAGRREPCDKWKQPQPAAVSVSHASHLTLAQPLRYLLATRLAMCAANHAPISSSVQPDSS